MKNLFYLLLALLFFSCGKSDTNKQTENESKTEVKKTESKTSNSTDPEKVKKTAADFKYDPNNKIREDYWGENSSPNVNKFNASVRILKVDEIENLYKDEFELIRNLVYARHGYIFKNPEFKSIFESEDWYVPVSEDVSNDLTKIELKNLELIKRFEINAKKYIFVR